MLWGLVDRGISLGAKVPCFLYVSPVCHRNYMNDRLRTNMFVRFQAETIASACIFLAARALQMPLPSSAHWFRGTDEKIKEICLTTLKLYTRKKPNYLEKEVELYRKRNSK